MYGKSRGLANEESAWLGPLWMLRARMAFFVSNLAFYLQVNVKRHGRQYDYDSETSVVRGRSAAKIRWKFTGLLGLGVHLVFARRYSTTLCVYQTKLRMTKLNHVSCPPLCENIQDFWRTCNVWVCVWFRFRHNFRWTWLRRRTRCFGVKL